MFRAGLMFPLLTLLFAVLAPRAADAEFTLQSSADQSYVYTGAAARNLTEGCAAGFHQLSQSAEPLFDCFGTGGGVQPGAFGGWALSLEFADEQRGYAGTIFGLLFETTDGGASWQEVPSAALSSGMSDMVEVTDIAVSLDGQLVVAAGSDGRLASSGDGGASWERVDLSLPSGTAIEAVSVVGEQIWIGGGVAPAAPVDDEFDPDPGHPGSGGFVLHSDDGGGHFETLVSGLAHCVRDLSFVNPAEGWYAGGTADNAGETASGALIGFTADGGQSWDTVAPPNLSEEEVAGSAMGATGLLAECRRVRFYGREVGLALCTTATFEYDGTPGLYLSLDAGRTWEHQPGYKDQFSNPLFAANEAIDLAAPDCRGGWIVGEGRLVMRWEADDQSIDCESGGAPGDEVPEDLAEEGSGGGGNCGCSAIGRQTAGALGALIALLP
jgi:photosystem II stability/assembly factor-like uncharacterized protein